MGIVSKFFMVCSTAVIAAAQIQNADTLFLGGKIVTVDEKGSIAQAVAIRGGRILAVGSDAQVKRYAGKNTKIIELRGKTMVPGLIESHVHPSLVAAEEAYQPYAELSSIPEIQSWIRQRAAQVPAGQWIKVPRNDITRLKERRHPTPAELDAASNTHPIAFHAARKNVLNTLGFKTLGIAKGTATFDGAEVIRDSGGNPLMIAGGDTKIQKAIGQPRLSQEQMIGQLEKILRGYNRVGITSIFERGSNIQSFRNYQQMRRAGQLTTRVTVALLLGQGSPGLKEAEKLVRENGVHQGDGDDWVKVGPLKLLADGGIHYGNTFLRVPFGDKRMQFYRNSAGPDYRGDYFYADDELKSVMRMGNRQGWQMTVHITGDAGVDRVLDAMEAANADSPIAGRRFTLVHAYFPTPEAVLRAKRLGVCVDTQPYLYYKDSPAIDEVYGRSWAERMIGVGDWIHGGVTTVINSDHMIGMDPDHAMNAFNPFLQAYIAVSRKNQKGQVLGERQKISRMEALRAITRSAAYVSFRDQDTGTIEAGKLADLAVLDRDYLTCPEEDIRKISVLLTMVGGQTVFDRNRQPGK